MRSERRCSRRGGTDRHRLVLIELVGTPGAGKTTMSHEIVELLQQEGVDAATIIGASRAHARHTIAGRALVRYAPRRWHRNLLWGLFYGLGLLHAFAFVREQPRLSRHIVSTQLRRPVPMTRRIHVCFWFFQLGGRQRFLAASARDGEALIVDDGFLHRSVHVYASHLEEPHAGEVAAYVDLLREPQLVLRVVAGGETCEHRVRQRGVWRHSRGLSASELSRYVANSDRVVNLAARRARERGWTVVDVDNGDRSPQHTRADLMRALQKGTILARASQDIEAGATS